MDSVFQAKKFFHDWLDSNRPWANSRDMYQAMEQIVDAAALYFADHRVYDAAKVAEVEQRIFVFTKSLKEHPTFWCGPCACAECSQE